MSPTSFRGFSPPTDPPFSRPLHPTLSTMSQPQKWPARPVQPPRRRSLSSKLDLDSAFFWLLLTFLLTTFTFISLRDKHISLNTAQIAEYERRTQLLSNSTVYIVEVYRPETLLADLAPRDWARVSVGIDFVAFVWDDLPVFLTDEWVTAAESVLQSPRLNIALFSCGCVIPNRYFQHIPHRLAGFECLLLPGWVMDTEDIHWLDVQEGGESCKRRDEVLRVRLAKRYRNELDAIRRQIDALNREPADPRPVTADENSVTEGTER